MASSENSLVPERFEAYPFRKQEFKVSQTMEILYKSKNWVIKRSVYGETGELIQKSGRPKNLCFAIDGK